jgi:hypothetical protein
MEAAAAIKNTKGEVVAQPVVIAYEDGNGGLLAVEYPGEPLTPDLAAAILGNIIKDTLGEEPDLRDVMTMQKALIATMQGGESEGKRAH